MIIIAKHLKETEEKEIHVDDDLDINDFIKDLQKLGYQIIRVERE